MATGDGDTASAGPHALNRVAAAAVSLIGFGIAAETLYATGFGLFYPIEQRAGILLASVVLVVFLAYAGQGKLPKSRVLKIARVALDAAMIAVAVWSMWHFTVIQSIMEDTIHELGETDVWAAGLGVLVLLELTRRVWG